MEHSALTGSNLHEPKGVSSATAGTLYVADGIGSGSWTTLGQSSLASAAKAFEAQLLQVRDEKASGTNGGTFTSGAWRTRTLNTTLTNEITSASLASNQITLPAGTYYVEASAPANDVAHHKVKLTNITDTSDVLIGTSETSNNAAPQITTRSKVTGRFTLAGTKVLELQHRCQTTRASDGFGAASSFSVNEVYADVSIWKTA